LSLDTVIKALLVLIYPLLLLGRVLNILLGRDPLRLREPKGATCWTQRRPEASRTSYFSEASEQEGSGHGGFGRLATTTLAWVSRRMAPPRRTTSEGFRAAADRDRDIPDEVYTLW
jgi:hypothetical protein